MKARMIFLGSALMVASFAHAQTVSLVGTFRPGIEHGKLSTAQAEQVRKAKAGLVGSSMRLSKDKSFGVSFAGRIMFGKYTVKGNILTLNVSEIVGKTKQQVAAMKAEERTARFVIASGGKKLLSLPDKGPGKPRIVWKMKAS
jgi:hypothetical protein